MRLVWPGTTIEEVGLARNVSLLRKALGEDGAENLYIETIPRRGYRFIGEVRVDGVGEAAGGWAGERCGRRRTSPSTQPDASAPLPRKARRWGRPPLIILAVVLALGGVVYWQFYIPSKYLTLNPSFPGLAVVPFEPLGAEPDRASLSQGFSELLVADLAKLGTVSVLSPSTVRRYQWLKISTSMMARVIGLEVLVEGTIQKEDGFVRVTPRLVDVHTGRVIWADQYEYFAPEWETRQSEAAREIAAQIGAHLAIHGALQGSPTPTHYRLGRNQARLRSPQGRVSRTFSAACQNAREGFTRLLGSLPEAALSRR